MTVVYSSEKGYLCPKCQEALSLCRCHKGPIKVRLEKNGRGGKVVSIVTNLPLKDLDKIGKELKVALGTGGAVKNETIEIQGDKVSAIQTWLIKKGYKLGCILLLCFLTACFREEKLVFPAHPSIKMIGLTFCEELNKPGSNLICSTPLLEEEALQFFKEAIPLFTKAPYDHFMALTFWDKEVNRIGKPYVARLELRENQIYIYYKTEDSEYLEKEVKIVSL